MADTNIISSYLIKLGYRIDRPEDLDTFVKKGREGADSLAKAFGVFGAIGTALTGATFLAANSMERIAYAAQRVGTAPSTLRSMASAAGEAGVNMDKMLAMLEQMGMTFRSGGETQAKAQVWLGQFAGGTQDATQALSALMDQMDAMYAKEGDNFGTHTKAKIFADMIGADWDTVQILHMNEGRFRAALAERKKEQETSGVKDKDYQSTIDLLNKMRDAMNDLELSWDRIALQVMPIFQKHLNDFSTWFDTHGPEVNEDLKVMGDALADIAKAAGFAFDALKGIGNILGEAGGVTTMFLRKNFPKYFRDTTPAPTPSASAPGSGTTPGFPHVPAPKAGDNADAMKKNALIAVGRLMHDLGISGEMANAIVGNLIVESGFNPAARNKDSGAYGLAQWLSPDRLKAFRDQFGHDIQGTGTEEQFKFLETELKGRYAKVLKAMKGAKSEKDMVRIFREMYESPRPSEAHDAARTNAAESLFQTSPLGGQGMTVNAPQQTNNITITATGIDGRGIATAVSLEQKRMWGDLTRYGRGVS
jgi:hypothetical protein